MYIITIRDVSLTVTLYCQDLLKFASHGTAYNATVNQRATTIKNLNLPITKSGINVLQFSVKMSRQMKMV